MHDQWWLTKEMNDVRYCSSIMAAKQLPTDAQLPWSYLQGAELLSMAVLDILV
jgi:hypothetical protein